MSRRGTGPVGVGVIGCGVIAYWTHLRLLQRMKGATLVIASDPSQAARENARRIVRAPIVEQAEEVLRRPDVDAVVICAPTQLHAELAVSALRAGKHAFIEKPIATTPYDAQRVMAAAKSAGLAAMVGFNRRLHPLFEQARRFIADGGIGRVHSVQSAFCEPMAATEMSEWRKRRDTGGGVLLDLGSHHVDLVRWFLGGDVESVDCRLESRETEQDTAALSLWMQNGASVQSFFSYRTARADYLEFVGERGTLLLDRHQSGLRVRTARRFGYGTRSRFVMPDVPVALWRVRRMARPSLEPSYARALALFVAAIRDGQSTNATLVDAARSLDVILAAEASGRQHSRVVVGS